MKKKWEGLTDLYQSSNGKVFFFFVFYFFFFLFVILFIRSNNNNNVMHGTEYERGNSVTFDVHSLLSDNYAYQYRVILDDEVYLYEGKKNKNVEVFSFQGKEYYRNENNFFVKDGMWIKTESPFLCAEFLDEEYIEELLVLSTYLSKTSYDSGKEIYNFLLSTNTINQKLFHINSDFMEEPNQILLSLDESKEISEIHYSLDSYCMLNQLCNKSLKIVLQYSQFGQISEIDNPIV